MAIFVFVKSYLKSNKMNNKVVYYYKFNFVAFLAISAVRATVLDQASVHACVPHDSACIGKHGTQGNCCRGTNPSLPQK